MHSSGSRGGHGPPGPVKISHKKMAAKDGRIDSIYLGPLYQAAGSATDAYPRKVRGG